MNHEQAVRTMAAERYLLDEFDDAERNEFEEHYFSCHECAEDVTAGAALFEHGKRVFVRKRELAAEKTPAISAGWPRQERPKRDWLGWLRPAFAIPALAVLLVGVGVQDFAQRAELHSALAALDTPAVMSSIYLASGSTRGEDHVVAAKTGEPFALVIDIPGESNTAYTAELYDSAGQKKWNLVIPADAAKENLSLKMPGNLAAGSYSLVAKRADVSGQAGPGPAEVSRYTFALKRE